MRDESMRTMKSADVRHLPRGERREVNAVRSLLRARRRRSEQRRSGGRAWINGREVGEPRFPQLAGGYD